MLWGLTRDLLHLQRCIGVIWDAINDPLVGVLSDKVRSKWGRRRPFLLIFAVPYGLAFLILWWTPPWQSQVLLMLHMMIAYALSDTSANVGDRSLSFSDPGTDE